MNILIWIRRENFFACLLLLLMVGAMFFLQSCAEAPPDRRAPQINYLAGGIARRDANVLTGDTVKIRISINSPSQDLHLKNLLIELRYDSVMTNWKRVIDLNGLTQAVIRFDTFARNQIGLEEWILTAETQNGGKIHDTIRYNVNPSPDKIVFRSFNFRFSNEFAFGSTLNGRFYKLGEAVTRADSIDLAFFYDENSGINLVSPVSLRDSVLYPTHKQSWTTRTTLWKATALLPSAFDKLFYNDSLTIINGFNRGTWVSYPQTENGTRLAQKLPDQPNHITLDKVWAFRSGNKTGLMRVISLEPVGRCQLVIKILK